MKYLTCRSLARVKFFQKGRIKDTETEDETKNDHIWAKTRKTDKPRPKAVCPVHFLLLVYLIVRGKDSFGTRLRSLS